ncbi:MAG: hypothetical protein Q3999_03045 [Buchananella hordeovulneris]|nr:hypothetical protein [Buchananella hordeovulneris]
MGAVALVSLLLFLNSQKVFGANTHVYLLVVVAVLAVAAAL